MALIIYATSILFHQNYHLATQLQRGHNRTQIIKNGHNIAKEHIRSKLTELTSRFVPYYVTVQEYLLSPKLQHYLGVPGYGYKKTLSPQNICWLT
jgi:hypothetical protein